MYLKHKQTGDCVRIDNLNDWEVVPETVKPPDHWEDVTRECRVCDNGDVRHGDLIFLAEFRGRHAYRLRKVRMWEELQRSTEEWAFRVERKVSD